MRLLIKLIALFFLVLILIAAMSCSAQWHLRKAVKKDPTLLEKKEPTVTTVKTEKVGFNFDPSFMFERGEKVTLEKPRKHEDGRIDTVRITLSQDPIDSAGIMALVDCPDPEVIRYPPQLIEIKPGFWQKAEWFGTGVIGFLLLSGLVILFRKIIFR